MSNTLTIKQKKFITNKLIPFILREHGRGFAMDDWIQSNKRKFRELFPLDIDDITNKPIKFVGLDGVNRRVPKCDTVACIGGSIQVLKNDPDMSTHQVAQVIGLTNAEAQGLFYNWEYHGNEYGWPPKYRELYKSRKTTQGKARVAVSLLRELVKKGPGILHNPERV